MKRFSFYLLAGALLSIGNVQVSNAADSFDQTLRPFFTTNCNDCHAGEEAEAGLDLTKLSADLHDEAAMATWVRIFDRVTQGEMPPKDYDTPSEKHIEAFRNILGSSLFTAHSQQKGTVLRRLNRYEYQNTLNDLFGTNLKLVELFPKDGQSHEFDNVGNALSVSMVQLQKYLISTDLVLNAAIAKKSAPAEVKKIKASYADMSGAEKYLGNQWLKLDDGAVVFYRRSGYPSGMLREANTRQPGFYKIRVTGYAHQTDKPVTFSIGATTFARGLEKPTFSYHAMPPGKPATVEIEAWIEKNYMVQIEPYGLYDRNKIREEGIEKYKGPGLAILHVELEGPLTKEFPSRGHKLLFNDLNRVEIEPRNPNDKKKSWYVPKFEITSENPGLDAEVVLIKVAEKAFRRPVDKAELKPYVALFEEQMKLGDSFEESLKTAVNAIFCSPDFLYFQEKQGWLEDYALATRLSYFLTRSTPDEELLSVAKSGKLTKDPDVLIAQTDRLLKHQNAQRFIEDFTNAWLDLRSIDFTTPDRNLFPEFDMYLQHSMLEESRLFFQTLLSENLGVKNIIRSDFAILNNRLAQLYGIDEVYGPEFRKVKLPSDSLRGGVLSQASVLKVSANGTNTSPVVRGVWVMDRIMGEPPAPPPPGVPGVEPDIRGAKTLREILDKHRNVQTCNSCHKEIDPPGFALECFNPVGELRDRFRTMGDGEKISKEIMGRNVRYKLGLDVDSTGQLADGREFTGFQQFRDYLLEDEEKLAKAFTTKLLTFATGRELGFSDRVVVDQIIKAAAKDGYRIRDILHLAVKSEIFRKK